MYEAEEVAEGLQVVALGVEGVGGLARPVVVKDVALCVFVGHTAGYGQRSDGILGYERYGRRSGAVR